MNSKFNTREQKVARKLNGAHIKKYGGNFGGGVVEERREQLLCEIGSSI